MGFSQQTSRGFTLLELLVVIGILAVLGAIVISSFYNFRSHRALELATKEARQIFEEARSRTLASVDDSRYGVFVATNKVVLFKGEDYIASDPENFVLELGPRVIISNFSFSPSTNIVLFERGTGEASASGFVEISLTNNSEKSQRVTISKQGIINSNE